MTTQTHQPAAYQIDGANGEFMCLSRTKSTVRGVTSKPLYDESALAAERAARIEAQQRLAEMQELAAKAGLAHMKAVADAVAEEVATEREACAEIAVDEDHIVDVPSYYAQLGDAKATARNIEKAIRARGTP